MAIVRFEYDVPLEQTMEFDAIYPEGLQLTLQEKSVLRHIPGAIFVWMRVADALAGEAYGVPITRYDEPIEGLSQLAPGELDGAMYSCSNTVLPEFQHQGYGSILKAHWLGLVAARGFKTIYGHARPGASQALNAKFGAVFLGDFLDWFGTGETYKQYRLPLRNP